MPNPLVSVHMITYNHAPYIAKAIECVLAQKTSFPFELVIGEDCSTDGTREIVLDYAQRFPEIIHVITSDQNVGMKQNSSRVTAVLRGKYIAWCEGDDYWHREDKLQLQVDYLESNPECGLVHSDYHRHYVASDLVEENFNRANKVMIHDNLSMSEIMRGSNFLYILTVTVMAKRHLVNIIKSADYTVYTSERFVIGDTPLWAEIASCAGTHYMAESLATYRVMLESASKFICFIKRYRFGINIHELFIYMVGKHGLSLVDQRYHEMKWGKYALLLAFHESNMELAESAKYYLGTLTFKQMVYYFGVKYEILGKVVRYLLKVRRGR